MDAEQAKNVIKEAKQAGASFEEFEKEVVWHCYQEVKTPNDLREHIEKQSAKLKKMWG